MFSEKVRFLKEYYRFRKNCKPRGGHGIHSPFVFELYTKTIDAETKESIFEDIERVRRNLKSSKVQVQDTTFGAGSQKPKAKELGQIVRNVCVPSYFGRLLYRLARDLKPETIIELGTSLGISTLYIANANRNSKVYSIEGDDYLAKLAVENLNNLGIQNVNVVNGDFDFELPRIISSLEKIDFAFIDGNHTKEATLRYFSLLAEKIHSGSAIIFDDIRWNENMYNAWCEICANEKVSISIDLFNCGIVFFRKGISKQHFYLRYGPF